jgi:hypothetical protein
LTGVVPQERPYPAHRLPFFGQVQN